MRTGYVDETWAREHHEYWYNDVRAGKVPAAVDTGACRAACGLIPDGTAGEDKGEEAQR